MTKSWEKTYYVDKGVLNGAQNASSTEILLAAEEGEHRASDVSFASLAHTSRNLHVSAVVLYALTSPFFIDFRYQIEW
jgi:hypothetical protein